MNLRASLGGTPVLEKYDLLEEIGHGGMATVYRAKDKRLGREVAVKILHKHLRESSEVAARFVAEARAAAKLRHPNIVEVYDVSADNDRYRFLVVELIRGTTLRKILQENREMPAEIGASIVLELCEALAHAHDAGIIHRDVKPENVLIELPAGCKGSALGDADASGDRLSAPRSDKSGATPLPSEGSERRSEVDRPSRRSRGPGRVVIKLTDFGIAKILDAQGVTVTGQVLGSPAHMAPEQIEGGEVDARTDVFALGVLMYEALVGHLPFEGKNPAQVLRRVLDARFAPPEKERPSVGARWSKIMAAALAREPEERTASTSVLAEQIREELAALGITDPPAEVLAYFRDPQAYTAALTERVVSALLHRGEAARKVGDSPAAAADFNRALALRPTDLSILKRITSLSASRNRRAMLRRAGLIVGTSAALGLTSFGIVRYAREQPPAVPPPPATTAAADTSEPDPDDTADPDLDTDIGPEPPAPPDPSGQARTRTYAVPTAVGIATVSPSGNAVAGAGGGSTRKVRFTIIPAGGRVTLDGAERNWLAGAFDLAFGPHSVRVTVPDADCCEDLTGSITVTHPPPDAPDSVEHFTLRVPLRPAIVRLRGAPANAQLFCARVSVSVVTGQAAHVKLPETPWTGTCEFRPPQADAAAKKGSVTLRAGRTNEVPWPG
ncbi:MAG: serine/threonine-protein kinase [Polyangiaceae bacterium]